MFLQSHNYDLNTLFDDESPLKKLSDLEAIFSEPNEK